MMVTHRRPDGRHDRYTAEASAAEVEFDTTRADLNIGESWVRQRDGEYRLHVTASGERGPARLDLVVRPKPNRWFPPVELRNDDFLSGYVVPALAATASGRVCAAGRCGTVRDAAAYHDHNWGVWRDVTWEWGAAQGEGVSLLYGGVYGPQDAGSSPFFLALADSLGVRRVLRFGRIDYRGARPADGLAGVRAPERFSLIGTWEADTVQTLGAGGPRAGERGGRVDPPAHLPPDARALRAERPGAGRLPARPRRGVLRDLSLPIDWVIP